MVLVHLDAVFFFIVFHSTQILGWQADRNVLLSCLRKTMMTISGLKIRRSLDWIGLKIESEINKQVHAHKKCRLAHEACFCLQNVRNKMFYGTKLCH